MSEEKTTVENDKATESNLETQTSEQKVEEKVDAKIKLKPVGLDKSDTTYKVDLSKKAGNEEQEELQSTEENNDSNKEVTEEEVDSPIEVVSSENEETAALDDASVKEVIEESKTEDVVAEETSEGKPIEVENPYKDIAGLDKLAQFIKETGGTVEDYVRVTADYSTASDDAVIKQYLRDTKNDFSDEDIDFYIEDKFGYDEDVDDEKDIRRKKLAFKEAAADARKHLNSLKEKYYDEVKLTSKLTPEAKEAVEFYEQYKAENAQSRETKKEQRNQFINETNKLFSDEFKGFEFNIGENKLRVKVKDVNAVKENQSDLGKVFQNYFDEKGMVKDAQGYHKALYAASNPDKLAQDFYNQGVADALKKQEKSSKNIQMDARKETPEYVNSNGLKVRVLPDSKDVDYKVKIKKQFKK